MVEKTRPTGIDLFCGVGGMSLGFEQAGFDVIAAFDFEPRNVETHEKNFPHCKTVQADISELSGEQLRKDSGLGDTELDVLFGGPPCQGFSMIGKRRLDDSRNLLLYDFARLVGEVKPRYFVMENVAGLMAGAAVKVLKSFIRRVKLAGYNVVEPVQVLCASDYGVPQKRKRVFILGARKGLPLPSYPDASDYASERPTVWDAIGDIPDLDGIKYLLESDVLKRQLGKSSSYASSLHNDTPPWENAADGHNGGLTGCMRTAHTATTIKRFAATLPGANEPVSRFHRLKKDGLANTLRAGTGPEHGSHTAARPIHPVYHRCITTREAARLHSYPDWFVFHSTKWHGFRQVGNSVPPRLAEAVFREILKSQRK